MCFSPGVMVGNCLSKIMFYCLACLFFCRLSIQMYNLSWIYMDIYCKNFSQVDIIRKGTMYLINDTQNAGHSTVIMPVLNPGLTHRPEWTPLPQKAKTGHLALWICLDTSCISKWKGLIVFCNRFWKDLLSPQYKGSSLFQNHCTYGL